MFWARSALGILAGMRAEILTLGDEICRGEIVDTNSAWLAEELWALDITVAWMTSCGDVAADMERAFADAIGRSDLVVSSGGLGATDDDLTVDVVAQLAGVAPVVDPPSRLRMEERFAAARVEVTPNQLRQVRVPHGAHALANPVGLAPGFELALKGVAVVCLPGIPAELQGIFHSCLRDRLLALRDAQGERGERIARRTYRVFGRGESQIAAALQGTAAGIPGASLHYQVKFPETLVKAVVRDRDYARAAARLDAIEERIRALLGPRLYGIDEDSLAAALGRDLVRAAATLATAESCTGGLLGSLITSVPGASEYYFGGAVTYSNREKVRQLGVQPETLAEHGAVSEACVVEMARGAQSRFGTAYATAVSGIAGPGGGTREKPVGTVWLAVASPDGTCQMRHYVWPGNREQVRTLAAHWGLAMTRAALMAQKDKP